MTLLLSPAFARAPRAIATPIDLPSIEQICDEPPSVFAPPIRVLVLETDRLYADALRAAVHRVFPEAFLRIGATFAEAERIIDESSADLVLTGLAMPDGDMFDLLQRYSVEQRGRPRVLAITSRKEQRFLLTLRALPIEGVFDPSTDGHAELEQAIERIASGGTYWSTSVLELLTEYSSPNAICRILTRREQDVLSIIGDGSDNEEAAVVLGIKAATVASIRRDLHRKLNVRHRGALIRSAVQHGFVRFTVEGVIRSGWAEFSGRVSARTVTGRR